MIGDVGFVDVQIVNKAWYADCSLGALSDSSIFSARISRLQQERSRLDL